jgi:hypothetical protein
MLVSAERCLGGGEKGEDAGSNCEAVLGEG